MDLRSMLNEDVDDRRSSSTHPSQTPQSRPTPTSANLNSPYGGPRSGYPGGGPNEYPFPPTHAQQQQQQSSWSDSRASHTPQRQPAPVLSPIKAPPPSSYASQYGHPVSTPTSSGTPGQYPPPHPYGMPSPSPSQDHFTLAHQSSPKLMRTSSYHSQYGTSSQHHPITPLGPAPSLPGSQHAEHHPPSLQHQGSSSASVYSTPQGMRVQSPKQVRPPRQSPTVAYSGHASSYIGPDNRPRDQSASVSPKTVPLQRDLSSQPLASPRPRGTYYSYPEGYTGAKQTQYTSQPATENKPTSSGTDSPSKQSASPASIKTKPKSNRVDMSNVLSQPTSADRPTFDPPRSAEAVITPSESTPKPYPPASVTPSTDKGDRPMLDESPLPKIEPDTQAHDIAPPRPLKRRRIKTPPIWAQPGRGTTAIKGIVSQHARIQSPSQPQARSNGSAQPVSTPLPIPASDGAGPLGPWEPSITNIQPFNDLTRQVANFLFNNIVLNESLPTGGAGQIPSPQGQLEIEAKIGRIIDRRTNERLRLPVRNEVVLDDTLEIAFESYMDEAQHSTYNEFLNDALIRTSLHPIDPVTKKARIKMDYVHTKESDSFYELPAAEVAALPPAVQKAIATSPQGQRRKRIRVTRDQNTGKELAKIVKIRLADLHVHSPNTDFDWRISVSLEANWTGDVGTLSHAADPEGGSTLERHKDRMSYKHLAFSIDLTQVKGDRLTHELEVELSSAEVRKQGTWAKEGRPQDYELLIQTFMDNIRILARYKKP